ncbi:MAG: cytochrome c biogenesis protein CcsA [Thermodesulfobacteriota bacterium]
MLILLEGAALFYVLHVLVLLTGRAGKCLLTGRIAAALVSVGFIAHTLAIILRIQATGHAPMASMFETLIFYAWCTVLVTIIVNLRYRERLPGLITLPVAVLSLIFAISRYETGRPLNLILQTRWFELHVTLSFAAYALFTLAFAGAILFLYGSYRWKVEGSEKTLRKYEDIAGKGVLWGFLLFSGAMISGAVWGYLAWGAYWLWEPKSIWSLILWFYYAGAMHAWYVRKWRGRGLSVATIIGFGLLLFTYLGVSLLMKSSHMF